MIIFRKIITQSQGKGSTSGLDDTSTRLSESPLQVSRNPSKLHINTAKVTVLPAKEGKENYRVDFSKEQCALLNELDPAERYSRYVYYLLYHIQINCFLFYI